MRTRRSRRLTALTLIVLAALQSLAFAEPTSTPAPEIPFAANAPDLTATVERLDEATTRVLTLEREIEAVTAETAALEQRVDVTATRVRRQLAEVERTQSRLAEARDRYRRRIVDVYKRGIVDPLAILLSADSISELLSRASVLTRIAEDDSRVVADLNIAAAETRFQASVLEDLLAQDRALQQEQQGRLAKLTGTLAEQEALIANLSEEAKAALTQARKLSAETRAQWRAASIPIGIEIPRATATVDPRLGVVYECSAYMPRRYRASGESFTATCSWYGNEFNGRPSASGQIFNEDDYTCASRTLPFGTVLALTRGERRVIVYVNDRGPFVAGRDLDLSKAAAAALGFSGVEQVSAEIVIPLP